MSKKPTAEMTPEAAQTPAEAPEKKPSYVHNTFASGGLQKAQPRRGGHGHGPGGRFRPGEKPKDMKGALKHLLEFMGKFKFGVLFVLIFAVGSTIFNIIGPKVMSRATTELFNGLVAKIQGVGSINFDAIFTILVTTLCIYIASAICSFIQGWLMTGITQRVCYQLRGAIARKIDAMPFGYFERNSVGDTLSRITNDVDTLGQTLNQGLTQLVTSVTTVIGVLIMMFSINVRMTLVTLLIIPLTLILIAQVVKLSQKFFNEQQATLGAVNGLVEETFSGHAVVRAFNQQGAAKTEFKEVNDRLYNAGWKSMFISGLMRPIMDFIGNAAYVAVAVMGSIFAVQGIITVGDIQAFIQYVKNFTQPLSQMAQVSNVFQQMAAAAERIFAFLDEPEEQEAADIAPLDAKDYSVDFEDVSFGYNPEQPVIKHFSAHVNGGETVALVGPTGAGKTTMVKLLMRFYDVQGGAIKIDGRDVRTLSRADVRSRVGMVLQETWLYSASIRENIRYGNLTATDAEVEQAAKNACAHEFIMQLPGGYDFVINEDASNISLGQRQLLTIARAFLADRPMMILDEATSSVDTRTEERIQEAMDKLMHGRTSFVIAHRLSTIKNADLILVIKAGDIVEQGSHEELLELGGFYADLYNSQFEDCKDRLDD